MLNFQVEFNNEIKGLFKEFIKELKILNEHIADFKKMTAPWLGFKVIKKNTHNDIGHQVD